MIENKIKTVVRDVENFPKEGIIFKDITPILQNPELCHEIADEIVSQLKEIPIDVIAAIESRGFLFGMMLANRLNKPFVPIRKEGKLPCKVIKQSYHLEYGTATIEIHEDAISKGDRVLIHDDLLATGGTVSAASLLIESMGGIVCAYSFIIGLDFLNGKSKLLNWSDKHIVLASY